jgi:hypothetical protein
LKTSSIYNITPETRIFENLGATGEATYKAIAEFIDNSLDAAPANEAVTVEIRVTNQGKKVSKIEISDDSRGMTLEQLADAFTLARSNKGGTQIGRFGMGLKTAIASLGRAWTVITATQDSKVQYSIKEDMDQFIANNNWQLTIEQGPKVDLPIVNYRGTHIEVTRCNNLNGVALIEDLMEHLPELFNLFIRSGKLMLVVNDEILEAPEVHLYKDGKLDFETLVDGKKVYGWVGLREAGSPNYGFSLIRSQRVVEKNVKMGFPADPIYNRVTGEIYLEDFPTNHHKTAFTKTSDTWNELEKYIAKVSMPTVVLARELAIIDRRRIDSRTQMLIEESLAKILEEASKDDLFSMFGEQYVRDQYGRFTNPNLPERPYIKPERKETQEEKEPRARTVVKGWTPLNKLKAVHEGVHLGEEANRKQWELVDDTLKIYTNLDHPAYVEEYKYQCAMRDIREALAAYFASARNEIRGLDCVISLPDYETCLDRLYRIQMNAGLINI